jgi:hypothetical protein
VFKWSWVPACGHSGGMLMGVNEELVEVTDTFSG